MPDKMEEKMWELYINAIVHPLTSLGLSMYIDDIKMDESIFPYQLSLSFPLLAYHVQ